MFAEEAKEGGEPGVSQSDLTGTEKD